MIWETKTLAKAINEAYPEKEILLGGVGPSLIVNEDRDKLEDLTEHAIVVSGYGEETIVELADIFAGNNRDLKDVNGIAYQQNEGVIITPRRPKLNLDELPFPDIEEPYAHYPFRIYDVPIQISRGCNWSKCSFCDIYSAFGKERNVRSPENIIEEMELRIKQFSHIKNFYGSSDNFPIYLLPELADFLRKHKLGIFFSARANDFLANNDIIERNLDVIAGMGSGIESLCDSQLRRYGKGYGAETGLEVLSHLGRMRRKKPGVGINFYNIFLDPEMTFREAEQFLLNYKKAFSESMEGVLAFNLDNELLPRYVEDELDYQEDHRVLQRYMNMFSKFNIINNILFEFGSVNLKKIQEYYSQIDEDDEHREYVERYLEWFENEFQKAKDFIRRFSISYIDFVIERIREAYRNGHIKYVEFDFDDYDEDGNEMIALFYPFDDLQ